MPTIYDDTQLSAAPDHVYGLLTHPTAPCLSAALTMTEARGVSGRELMTAYHLGVEAESKIAEAINPRHYQDEFHSTGTCGTFFRSSGCDETAGGGRARMRPGAGPGGQPISGFARELRHYDQAVPCGPARRNLASWGRTWRYEGGRPVSRFWIAHGFFHAAGGSFDPAGLASRRPWTFASPGVSIKPFPSGSLTHPAMSELQRLIRANHITPEQVERLDVGTNKSVPTALIHRCPPTSLQAKFSMEFCMATLLLYGRAGLNEFTDEVVNRPEVQAMIARVRFGVHPVAEVVLLEQGNRVAGLAFLL